MIHANRNQAIDLVKIIAMFGVVSLHSTHKYINEDFGCANIMYEISVISIPLFFMSSGYLLLGKKNITYKYSFKKIMNIIRFVLYFSLLFGIVSSIKHNTNLISNVLSLFIGSLMQQGRFFMFWYFGAMILIYLLLPLLSRLYYRNFISFLWLMTIMFLFAESFFLGNMLKIGGVKPLEANITQTFRLYIWLFYFMLGGLMRRITFLKTRPALVVFLISYDIVCQELINQYTGINLCEFYYSSVFVIILCAAIFIYVLYSISIEDNHLIAELSNLFLPVYASHTFIISKIGHIIPFESIGFIAPLIHYILSITISIAISWIIMRTPYINKIFRI